MALTGLAVIVFGWVLMFLVEATLYFAWIIVGIGAALIVAAALIDFRAVRSTLASGKGRFGVGTSLAVSLFLGIMLLVNAINLTWSHRFDLTGYSQFTLSTQTREILRTLPTDVEATALFTPSVSPTVQEYTRALLDEYAEHGDRLTVRTIDPELEPDEARRFSLTQREAATGVVIFRTNAAERRVAGSQIVSEAENAFTTALLEVTGEGRVQLYATAGHGERRLTGEYAGVRQGLLDNLFAVDELRLDAPGGIPSDAAALIVAGPREELSPVAYARLADYLAAGGDLMLLLDPDPPQSFRRLAREWGVAVTDGFVVDPDSFVAPLPTNPLVSEARNAFRLSESFLFGASATLPAGRIDDQPVRPNLDIVPLVWTSDSAWLETTSDSAPGGLSLDPDRDIAGPLAMGVLISSAAVDAAAADEATRIVVIGDSDFAAGRNYGNGANAALFLSAITWLTEGDDVVTIDRRPLIARRLVLSRGEARFLALTSVGLMPLLLLVLGGVVWWRRRR